LSRGFCAYAATHPRTTLDMATATTSDFRARATQLEPPPFSLIEYESLLARLTRELRRAASELARDPRGFVRGLIAPDLTDDPKEAKRRRRLVFGMAGALVLHVVLVTVIAIVGWRTLKTGADTTVIMVDPGPIATLREAEPTPQIPRGTKDSGGGNGGK